MAESMSTEEESDLEFSSPGSNSSVRSASEKLPPAKRILCPHCDSMLSRRSFFRHKSLFFSPTEQSWTLCSSQTVTKDSERVWLDSDSDTDLFHSEEDNSTHDFRSMADRHGRSASHDSTVDLQLQVRLSLYLITILLIIYCLLCV